MKKNKKEVENMAYGVKVGIKAKDIYDRLTPAEKERRLTSNLQTGVKTESAKRKSPYIERQNV